MQRFLSRLALAMARAVFAALCLVSCTGAQEIAGGATAEGVNAFLDELVRGGRRSFPAGELEAWLGGPRRMTRTMVAEKTLDVQQYFGLEVGVDRTVSGVDVQFVALTGPRYTAPEGLRVGYAEQEVLRVLGRPSDMNASTWIFTTTEDTLLLVEFENRTVSRITWKFGEGGR